MKSFVFVLLVSAFFSVISLCVYAKEAKILAIVDNEIISNLDLEKRRVMLRQISGKELSEKDDLLQYLIDEHLFFKYAKDFKIDVTDAEVSDAIQSLGIKSNTVDHDELFKQIKAKMVWNKMISQYVLPIANVSEQEVDNYIKNHLTLKETVNLVKRFEKQPGIWEETPVGWVDIKSLEPKVRATLEKLGLNEISTPVHDNGQVIQFKIVDIENEHVLKTHFKIRKLENSVQNYSNEHCSRDTVDAKGSEFSSIVRENLLSIKENQLSKVINERIDGKGSEYRIVLCGSSLRKDLHQHIFMSKIEEEQKKYLLTLRQNSFIEVKA